MITKREAKLIKSLQLKKFRLTEAAFIIEGEKNVIELLNSDFHIKKIYGSESFIEVYENVLKSSNVPLEPAMASEISNVSFLKTNTKALAIASIPTDQSIVSENFMLAFDNVQDPGNLGTIIRTVDWYGFKQIICSKDTVDCYNPKVIAATMGSFTRIKVHYLDLEKFIDQQQLPVYGALLNGENLHKTSFEEKGILLFGNESKGISTSLQKSVTKKVLIPGYGQAESLNVAMATTVFCDNLRRLKN